MSVDLMASCLTFWAEASYFHLAWLSTNYVFRFPYCPALNFIPGGDPFLLPSEDIPWHCSLPELSATPVGKPFEQNVPFHMCENYLIAMVILRVFQ